MKKYPYCSIFLTTCINNVCLQHIYYLVQPAGIYIYANQQQSIFEVFIPKLLEERVAAESPKTFSYIVL